jgi:hypothetical protein
MKLGMIVRSDNSGLGNQTYELAQMLKPYLLMVIDFSDHNGFKQYPERYDGFNVVHVKGMPTDRQMVDFISEVDAVFSCETFYNQSTPKIAKRSNDVKTYLQYNFELFGGLGDPNYPLPTKLIAPSVWHLDYMQKKYGDKVEYLPPPTNPDTFTNAREANRSTHKKLLHIAGKPAKADRNGTQSVLEMLKFSKADYELVIRVQTEYDLRCNDSRVKIEYGDIDERGDMYAGYDAMILPRRYAGLCLPMNEALLSGLPVFMTDVSPNNFILPKEWLCQAEDIGTIRTKTSVSSYNANPKTLGRMIDNFIDSADIESAKQKAYEIGYKHFATERLLPKYEKLLGIEKG